MKTLRENWSSVDGWERSLLRPVRSLWAALLLCLPALSNFAQDLQPNQTWRYTLLEGSTLLDDCPVCGRPAIIHPLRGTFELALLEAGPIGTRYELRNISFIAGSPATRIYRVLGKGTWEISSALAVQQRIELQVAIDDGFESKPYPFANPNGNLQRVFPMFEAAVVQTNGTLTQVYHLTIAAAPLREVWFSTVSGFTAANLAAPSKGVSAGDLISSVGRIVKRNRDLTARLGIQPVPPDVGLDAVDIVAGGEILFSINDNVFSETLGPLHHGDVLSSHGRIAKTSADLISNFGPEPGEVIEGLDALQTADGGKTYFSVSTGFNSGKLGAAIGNGDLLSDAGETVFSNTQLLSRFSPTLPDKDYGLAALYVWPSGEIWFGTDEGFADQTLGPISRGDLLSNQGYVVFRNLDLVSAFAPVEDASNFGLDALFIVTDVTPPASAPHLTRIETQNRSGAIHLEWEGKGRVFQLEMSPFVTGPYFPASPIVPDLSYENGPGNAIWDTAFYRLRQW